MIRTLDTAMLNIPHSYKELAPIAVKYGFQAISVPVLAVDNQAEAKAAAAVADEYGISWGLLPMPADFLYWDLDDHDFEKALETLKHRAEIGEMLGITHAYNHVWPTSFREFDRNFEWHVKRVGAINSILQEHGIHYGLEFLGPHALRSLQKYEFVHSLPGVLSIADAAGENVGIAFDVFHWYCSGNGCPDDLIYMAQHTERLVAVHLNDAVAGVPYDKQEDQCRRLPLESGVIDTRNILARFRKNPNDALYMIEPFEPGRTRFNQMAPEEAVQTAAAVLEKLEGSVLD